LVGAYARRRLDLDFGLFGGEIVNAADFDFVSRLNFDEANSSLNIAGG